MQEDNRGWEAVEVVYNELQELCVSLSWQYDVSAVRQAQPVAQCDLYATSP